MKKRSAYAWHIDHQMTRLDKQEAPRMNHPKILAPAGGQEQLLAAVRCGSDAVYLGGKGFNARRNAANFGDEELCAAARYWYSRYRNSSEVEGRSCLSLGVTYVWSS